MNWGITRNKHTRAAFENHPIQSQLRSELLCNDYERPVGKGGT